MVELDKRGNQNNDDAPRSPSKAEEAGREAAGEQRRGSGVRLGEGLGLQMLGASLSHLPAGCNLSLRVAARNKKPHWHDVRRRK